MRNNKVLARCCDMPFMSGFVFIMTIIFLVSRKGYNEQTKELNDYLLENSSWSKDTVLTDPDRRPQYQLNSPFWFHVGAAYGSPVLTISMNFIVLVSSFLATEWFHQRSLNRGCSSERNSLCATMTWVFQWFIFIVCFGICLGYAFICLFNIGMFLWFSLGLGVCHANLTDLTGTVNELLTAARGFFCTEERLGTPEGGDLCLLIPKAVTQQDVNLTCNFFDAVWTPQLQLFCIGCSLAFWQMIVVVIQRGNIVAHNTRNARRQSPSGELCNDGFAFVEPPTKTAAGEKSETTAIII